MPTTELTMDRRPRTSTTGSAHCYARTTTATRSSSWRAQALAFPSLSARQSRA